MAAPPKPLPAISPIDRPYWEATRRHELRLQRCLACGRFRYPASPVCPDCDADRHEWALTAGRGHVLSWVVFHRCYFPSFADEIPYNVAMIELDEGPVVVANVVGVDNAALHRGLEVDVVFEDVSPEITIPKFRPGRVR